MRVLINHSGNFSVFIIIEPLWTCLLFHAETPTSKTNESLPYHVIGYIIGSMFLANVLICLNRISNQP